MTTIVPGNDVRLLNFGQRAFRAGAVLPATGNQTIFTVTGRIILTSLIGQVTTVASATATNLKITAAPTVGTAVDLCANAAITSKEVGSLVSITGTFADALLVNNAGATPVQDSPGTVIAAGVIRITTDATNTGALSWTALWIPLDSGSTLVAA